MLPSSNLTAAIRFLSNDLTKARPQDSKSDTKHKAWCEMLTFSLISRFSFFFFIKKTFYTISLFKFPDGILSCSGALPKTKSLKQRENLSFINTEECYTFETILLFCAWTSCLKPIVIKPGPGIDLVKKPGSRFYGSTRKFTNFSFFWKLLTTASTPKKVNIPTTL